jgi:integral membrane protein (TIGR00529 family)
MLSSLLLILVVNQKTKVLTLAVLCGTLLMGFWTGNSLPVLLDTAVHAVIDWDTLFLALSIGLIITLSSLMAVRGVMNDMVSWVTSRMHTRISMAVLPAIIGLLPMPGGALFSAPLVDDCDIDRNVEAEQKAAINFWYRHIWEFFWPIYPGVLLAIDITGLPILTFIGIMCPMTLFAVGGGYLFLLRRVKGAEKGPERGKQSEKGISLFMLLLPIITVLVIYTLIQVFIPVIGDTSKYLSMFIGLIGSLAVLQIQKPGPLKQLFSIMIQPKTLIMVFLIISIKLYGAYVESAGPDGRLLMAVLRDELQSVGIPIWLTLVVLPFFSGLTMGIAVGLVGASFPIVVQLLGQMDPSYYNAGILIALSSGWIGMMLSPVHVCLIVTNQHFKTGLLKSLSRLIGPSLVLAFGAVFVAALHILL